MNLRKQLRADAVRQLFVCMLASLPTEELDLVSLPYDLKMDVMEAKTDDDYLGKGAAYAVASLSNAPLTDQDRLVVGQIFLIGGAKILSGGIVTKAVLDAANVLENRNVFSGMVDWISKYGNTPRRTGDAWAEELERIFTYVEQYDRDVKDTSIQWNKREGEGDIETPSDITPWLEWIPFVGK